MYFSLCLCLSSYKYNGAYKWQLKWRWIKSTVSAIKACVKSYIKNWLCELWTRQLNPALCGVCFIRFYHLEKYPSVSYHNCKEGKSWLWEVFFYLWLVFKYVLIMAVFIALLNRGSGGAGSEPILALGEVKDATMTGCQSIARLTKTKESYSCSHSPLQLIYKPVHLDEYSFILFWKNTFCLRFIS